ncbi:MAG: HD domain-containing protein [Defluviitaleaceae bacterium]|nr:HD domain-containing protein [Defluviitaleaceae bacterium]
MDKLFIDDIMPNSVLAQDVYGNSYNLAHPLLRKGSVISADYLYKLKERGIDFLYVKQKIMEAVGEPGTNPHAKFNIPYQKAKSTVSPIVRKDAVKSLRNLHIISQGSDPQATANAVNHLCDVLTSVVDGMHASKTVNIHQIQSVDEFIYHHSLSVTVLSLAIGQGLGLSKTELFNIAQCALFHDVGKYLVPPEILNKKDLLNEKELRAVKRHSAAGYEYMKKSNMLAEKHQRSSLK